MEVLGDATNPGFKDWIRGWIRPRLPLPAFLEEYSRLGGTHHAALVPGDRVEALIAFAEDLGIESAAIPGGRAGG